MKRKSTLLALTLLIAGGVQAQTWTQQASGFIEASRGIRDISIVNPGVAWATAYDGTGGGASIRQVTRTLNGGETWIPISVTGVGITATNDIANIVAISADTAWVSIYPNSGTSNGVYITTNGGQTWTKQATALFNSPGSFLNWVHFFDNKNGVCMGDAAGGYFEIYKTSNGGTNWERITTGNIPAILDPEEYGTIGFFTARDSSVWFSTTRGRIFFSNNLGATWSVGTNPFPENTAISTIAFKDKKYGLAAGVNPIGGANEGIIKTNDGGLTWTILAEGITGDIDAKGDIVFVPGTDSTFFMSSAGTTPGTAYSTDGGKTWTNIDAIQHTTIAFLDENTGFSGGFNTNNTTGGMFKWLSGNDTPPIAIDDDLRAFKNMASPLNVLGNDYDNVSIAKESITIVENPSNGSVEVNTIDGTIIYTPSNNFTGSDALKYTVKDGAGTLSNIANVKISVEIAPSASNDSTSTLKGKAVTINVLGNDVDGDGTLDLSSVTIVTKPAKGTTKINTDGTITFTPPSTFVGAEEFTYTVKDNRGNISNIAKVKITVLAPSGIETENMDVVLGQNYPNPAKESTSIIFNLKNNADVSINITNVLGEQVYSNMLSSLNSGKHSVDVSTKNLSDGIYYYTLTINGRSITQKMVVTK